MANNVIVPDAFAVAKPAAVFAALDPTAEKLSDGIGSSYGVIGYRGKVWSLRYRGENHIFARPDDGTPISYIDVVVLRQLDRKSKSFYSGGYEENQSDGKRPTCASIDGIVPDSDVQQKQSDACALCPRNAWRTSPKTGKRERECTDYKRLAVFLLPSQTAQVLGMPLVEPLFLRIPPASLQDLGAVGDEMSRRGYHFSSFTMRISFDPEKSHPKMVFRPLQPLGNKEGEAILQLRNDPTALRITGEDQLDSRPSIPQVSGPPAPLRVVASNPDLKPPPHVGTHETAEGATVLEPSEGAFGMTIDATPTVLSTTTVAANAETKTAVQRVVQQATQGDNAEPSTPDIDNMVAALLKLGQ